MDPDEHLGAFERELSATAKAVSAGDSDAVVPSCPGWTLRDLTEHVGGVVGMWTDVISEGLGVEPPDFGPLPDSRAGEWLQDRGTHLVELLRTTPFDVEVKSFDPNDQSCRWIRRRTAHEVAVHRVDAELAAWGEAEAINAHLAADGVEEIVALIDLKRGGEPAPPSSGPSIHLHATDADHELVLHLGEAGVRLEHGHLKADLALRGAMSDLELVLYGRPTAAQVERLGDESVLDRWYEAFTFG